MSPDPFKPNPRIILFAALPQETAVVKRRTGPWKRLSPLPCPAWRRDAGDRGLLLVETGMGDRRLAEIFKWAVSGEGCDLLVSFGFGGGLTPGLRVGDICLCDRFCRWDAERRSIAPEGLSTDHGRWMRVLGAELSLTRCIDVTTPRLASKEEIALQLDPLTRHSPTLVDMESFALAQLAREASIPFLTLRSISDELGHELDFDLSSVADKHGSIEIRRIARSVLGRPALLLSLHRLWRDSRRAAASLGEAVATLVDLPARQLRSIAGTSRVSSWNVERDQTV
jgi:adenosylhomocysteine nucleosidase